MSVMEQGRYYVKAASRFFLVDGTVAGEDGGGGYFLDACYLCKRDITSFKSDRRYIFMYRGDAAFCSDECRRYQMDMDASLKAVARRRRHPRSGSSSSSASAAARDMQTSVAVHAPAAAAAAMYIAS